MSSPALGGAPAAPWRPLLLLSGVLLTAHLTLLNGVHLAPLPVAQPLSRPLITRTVIEPNVAPAAPPQAVAPRPKLAAKPTKQRTAPPPSALEPNPAIAPSENTPAAIDSIAQKSTTAATEGPGTAPSTAESPAAASATVTAETRPSATVVPGSLRIKYELFGEVRMLPYTANAELLWTHDGLTYEAQLEISAFLLGSRRQTSRGQLTPGGLAPKRFGDKVRSEVAAHFEYDKGKVIFSANTPAAALQPGAQDQLSIFVQIASLIAAEPQRYPRGSAIEMQAVGPRESDTWRFVVDGTEHLNLPGGEQDTLKLTRPRRQPYDLMVELWLAPALGYLPVRIKLTQDNGDFIDQQWRSSGPP